MIYANGEPDFYDYHCKKCRVALCPKCGYCPVCEQEKHLRLCHEQKRETISKWLMMFISDLRKLCMVTILSGRLVNK